MSSSTVYLEDVETNVNDTRSVETRQEDRPPSSPAPSSTPSLTKFANASQGSGSNIKRQRTLVDMFTGSQGKSSLTDEPSVKKLKLTPSGSSMSSSSSIKSDGLKIFGLQKLNSIPFSMSEYLETLTDDQKRLLRLECEVMGKSWLKLLKDEIKKPYFIALKQFLWDEGVRGPDDSSAKLKIYPAPKNIYAWSNTPLGKVKVVILGQDPYYQRGQAHAVFSGHLTYLFFFFFTPVDWKIYIELREEYPEFEIPNHGNLTAWALNGVLMLNTCLTVRAGEAGSHLNRGWEEFTDRVVNIVDNAGIGRGVVFLAWGAPAGKRVAKLDKVWVLADQSKRSWLIIGIIRHPSPKSVDRGFRGNNHFKLANAWLEKRYGPEGQVDWCNLDVKEEA
ncbi:Uracil-DNA glycosylase, mitochondrial [Termitomyces sp. J132]|nr:Uracil-DNA glycosylase, mitochondrial [Termitomyces sp. J132]